MKHTILRPGFAIGLLLLACTTYAENSDVRDPIMPAGHHTAMERAVKHQINRFVIFPLSEDAGNMYGSVDIAYVVNAEGRVVVMSSASKNKALCEYVVQKLARIQVGADPSGLRNISRVRLTFRPE